MNRIVALCLGMIAMFFAVFAALLCAVKGSLFGSLLCVALFALILSSVMRIVALTRPTTGEPS